MPFFHFPPAHNVKKINKIKWIKNNHKQTTQFQAVTVHILLFCLFLIMCFSYPCAKLEEKCHTKKEKNMKSLPLKIKNERTQSLNLIFPQENFKTSIIFHRSFLHEILKTSVKCIRIFPDCFGGDFLCNCAVFVRFEALCLASSWNSHFLLALSWLVYPSLSLLKLDKARI